MNNVMSLLSKFFRDLGPIVIQNELEWKEFINQLPQEHQEKGMAVLNSTSKRFGNIVLNTLSAVKEFVH